MSAGGDALDVFYRGYIDCLNRQDWADLPRYVAADVVRNGQALGLAGYRAMLKADFHAIPDLRFVVGRLACDPPLIAARLAFDCTPRGLFLDLPVNGRRVRFAEHVFYEVREGRIVSVESLIDREAIAAQL